MPVVFQKFIKRQDLRANRDKIYVFGDNVQRIGFGGQAREMRNEPNAIGIVTKWAPSNDSVAFFDDTSACRVLVERDLLKVQQELDRGKTVVVPADGIGTGLARLPYVAPKLNECINSWFKGRT